MSFIKDLLKNKNENKIEPNPFIFEIRIDENGLIVKKEGDATDIAAGLMALFIKRPDIKLVFEHTFELVEGLKKDRPDIFNIFVDPKAVKILEETEKQVKEILNKKKGGK